MSRGGASCARRCPPRDTNRKQKPVDAVEYHNKPSPFECRRRHRQSSFNPLNVLLSAPNCLRIAASALYFRFVTSIVFTVVILPRFSSRRVFRLNCLNCFQDILRRNGHRGVRVGPCFQLQNLNVDLHACGRLLKIIFIEARTSSRATNKRICRFQAIVA